MTAWELLADLRHREIELWPEEDALRYRAAPGVVTPELLRELSARKREILTIFQYADNDPSDNRAPIVPIPRTGPGPLSYAQQRLWFLDRLDPDSPLYNLPEAMKIGPGLDVDTLQQALDSLVARQEILRTNFVAVNGVPRLILRPPGPVAMRVVDVSALPEAERDDDVQRQLTEEAQTPFDLSRDPMLRILLLKVGGGEHVLELTTHHIVCDGWSMGILFEDLAALYEGYKTGNDPALSEIEVQYADYANWQSQWMRGQVYDSLLRYWKSHLGESPPILDLPTDRPRPAQQSYRGACERFTLSADLSARLRAFALAEASTSFMLLFASFQVLLFRYSGLEKFVLGSPTAVYNRIELMPLIGLWVNTLAMRCDLSGNPSFRELLSRVRDRALDDFAHQEFPFEKLVEETHPDRDLSRNPIFQVMFILQVHHAPSQNLKRAGLEVSPLTVDTATAKFDLTLSMSDAGDHFGGVFEYGKDLFDAETIAGMIEHFRCLLEAVVADPDRPIAALPLQSESERHRMLIKWNDTKSDYPDESGFHQLFEAQVKRTPGSIAVESDGERLTYDQLNRSSNRLAHRLLEWGVGPDVLVGICMEPTPRMLVGLLGILKAGGAYVPLDPEFPPDRLKIMLEDSAVGIVLSEQRTAELIAVPERTRIIHLDADPETMRSGENERNPVWKGTACDLAYVIFTSGSTGRPKGVQIPHRALVNFLCSMRDAPGLTQQDVLLEVTTLSFDIAALELYLPLLVGARVSLARREVASDGMRLAKRIAESRASVMQATPATWRLLLESGWQGDRRLKILCGGEALPRELAEELLQRCGSLWNMYGPTETTIWSTAKQIHPGEEIRIGRPIANTRVYVFDKALEPVPTGVVGELCIGGDGLARGYLDRVELTGEKFVANPFEPGHRLYRTGDLARFRPGGDIECLGRVDHQVKVRGFRIEPGEIETHLESHERVTQAVVLAREDRPGDKRLIGYITTDDGSTIPQAELRNRLRQSLPDYMVPSRFIVLKQFPLTPNGKIDRPALPAPDETDGREAEVYVAPRNATERQLAKLWEKVLGRQRVGVTEDFFEAGGHSLLAAQLFALIETTLGANLPLATLFQSSTVEELARLLQRENWSPSWASLVPIQPKGSKPPLYCVHGAEGNILIYRDLSIQLGEDQPLYGLQTTGLDGTQPLLTRFEEMAALYIREIKTVQPEGPYYLAGYCLGGALAYEMAQQLRAAGEKVGLVALFETYRAEAWREGATYPFILYHKLQNVAFHARNMAMLDGKERTEFLRRKARIEATRARMQLKSVYRKAVEILSRGAIKGGQLPHVKVSKMNDRAEMLYEPKPYDGRVVLFRPRALFARCEDPAFGWGDLAAVETHVLSVYPRGMLIPPFVNMLARQLTSCLGEARDTTHEAA
jgi:aspartate racemase